MDMIPTLADLRMSDDLASAEPFSGGITPYPRLRECRARDGSAYYQANMKIHADPAADQWLDWRDVTDGDLDALREAYDTLSPQIRAINAGWARAGKLDDVFVAVAASSVTLDRYPREHLVAYFRTAEDRDAFVAANGEPHGRWHGFAAGEYREFAMQSVLVPPAGQWKLSVRVVI